MGVNHGGLIPTAAPGTGGGGGGGVTSFNTRTGAVVPATGDYLAVPAGGLTGATAATRYVGGTTSGPPTTGTFAVGDFVVDQTATIWICVGAGTPGTWSPTIQSALVVRSATATAGPGEITIFGTSGASGQTITLPANPTNGALYQIKNISSYPVNIVGGTNSVSVSGTIYGSSTPYTIPTNCAYTFNYSASGGVWYCFVTTDLAAMGNTLPVANGGTGATTGPSALVNLGTQSAIVNAVNYGADPTGATDSSTAINAAINACPNGGTVYIPPGTYTISNPIVLGNGSAIAAPLAASMNGVTPSGTFTLTVNTANQSSVAGAAFATGGGQIALWSSNSPVLVAYTSYNSSTGVFSGCTIVSGTAVALSADGTYANSVLVSQGTNSTKYGITLTGNSPAGVSAAGFIGYKQNSTVLNCATGSYTVGIDVRFVMGWAIHNLTINVPSTGTIYGVRCLNASYGTMSNCYIGPGEPNGFNIGPTLTALRVTGFPGFPVNTPSQPYNIVAGGASISNSFTNMYLESAIGSASSCVQVVGDTGGKSYPSANATFNLFTNLTCVVNSPGTGNTSNAIYIGFADDCTFRTVDITNGTAGTGTCRGIYFDYTQYPNGYAPFNCLVEDVFMSGFSSSSSGNSVFFGVSGSPALYVPYAANRIVNVRGNYPPPTFSGSTGVYWQPCGVVSTATLTNGTPLIPCWWQPTQVTFPVTKGSGAGTYTITITPNTGGASAITIYSGVAIAANTTVTLNIIVPANYGLTLTGTGITSGTAYIQTIS